MLTNREEFDNKYGYHTATPMMQQYLNIKYNHQDCLLLFRMGDFYELFFEDAVLVSKELGLVLAKRGKHNGYDLHMSGMPYHALDIYLKKLIENGHKLAICDQIESPEEAKKRGGYKAVVNREVQTIITPGTINLDSVIDSKVPNYLISIYFTKKDFATIGYVDVLTSEIGVFDLEINKLKEELSKLNPKEILVSDSIQSLSDEDDRSQNIINILREYKKIIVYRVNSTFAYEKCLNIIKVFYSIHSLDGISNLSKSQVSAIGSVLEYVDITHKNNKPKLPLPKIANKTNYISLDSSTVKNLELFKTSNGNSKGSLFSTINKTITNQGSRLLYKFIISPLKNVQYIKNRLKITKFFVNNPTLNSKIRNLLLNMGDINRIITKISIKNAQPQDLISLATSLSIYFQIQNLIYRQGTNKNDDVFLKSIQKPLGDMHEIIDLIRSAIIADTTNNSNAGGFILESYHPKVKDLRMMSDKNNSLIESLVTKYRNISKVDSLKINNNNVLGLFIEVTNKNAQKMVDNIFIHKQSTTNAARYITDELKTLESDIIHSNTLLINLEKELFIDICNQIIKYLEHLHEISLVVSRIDVFTTFAHIALSCDYTEPYIYDESHNDTQLDVLSISDGRHPVIENISGCHFIPNNTSISENEKIILITGPNMGGKSTYLRQNAIIVLLAQIGSFVPAKQLKLNVVDQIFTRIGANDDLSSGQSTFMVEMLEVSSILSQATSNSLIILDEVGRGTSTFDGVSIAWSILEYIHDHIQARCLFATHYHELSKLEQKLANLVNYTAYIEESDQKIIFSHKIIKGCTNKSYGLHVAKIAGVPESVVQRAKDILNNLEQDHKYSI